MTTFADFRTEVAEALRDPGKLTFTDQQLKGMVNRSLAEVGRVAPRRFREDIQPVADTYSYAVQAGILGAAVPEIEIQRVELWYNGEPTGYVPPADAAYVAYSQTGWKVWDGNLEIPVYVLTLMEGAEPDYLLKVWGYAPYPKLVADGDLLLTSPEREAALVLLCRIEALQMLLAERDLFSQWQAGANNTDVSPASLMNSLSLLRDEWRRTKRDIAVLREGA